MYASYLISVGHQFRQYKLLGEKAMAQVGDEHLFWQPHPESNSIATIVKHLSGNMISRWTDIFNSDGEKDWRNRDAEFVNDIKSREELIEIWDKGWNCFFNTFDALQDDDLAKIIYIRNESHTVMDALNRQLTHYPYHVGQIVYVAKLLADNHWTSLSIPRNKSDEFNQEKFSSRKR